MAFFKFRKGGDEQSAPVAAPESIEALRKRARHRLIGAAVLVLLGVIGFPLLFDNQPRPVAVDIPIEIPDRNKVKPLGTAAVVPPAVQASAAAVSAPLQVPSPEPVKPLAAGSRVAGGAISAASAVVAVSKPETKPELKPASAVKPPEKPAEKPLPKVDDSAKARALLEGKDSAAPASVTAASAATTGARFIVQVGAFAEVLKAREARVKLEKAGLKTYTQVVQPPEGKRIRVRVGPFESKAEADTVAEKIKKLDLPASVLEL
jgi:DedD protein